MIVVDTNVIVSMWVPNNMGEWAYKVLRKDSEWIAPILWRSEFRNVLSLYLRKGILDLPELIRAMDEAEESMKSNEFEITSINVLSLVSKSDCSAYDCEFVSLAQELNTKLITFDKKIIREFPEIAVSPREFVG